MTFVLSSPLRSPAPPEAASDADRELLQQMAAHLTAHGDGVKDVAFEVDDVEAVYTEAVRNGAKAVCPPRKESDTDGWVVMATVRTYGDTTHTLVERHNYSGAFLPGYRAATTGQQQDVLPAVTLEAIDHCVGNQGWGEMEETCE